MYFNRGKQTLNVFRLASVKSAPLEFERIQLRWCWAGAGLGLSWIGVLLDRRGSRRVALRPSGFETRRKLNKENINKRQFKKICTPRRFV